MIVASLFPEAVGRYTKAVMAHRCWDESYAAGELPWDTGEPEPLLVNFVTAGRVPPTRTLEIGAGTGTNALWLAERGFEVLGIDVAPHAIERATAKLDGRNLNCGFRTLDFLLASPPEAPFHFVFDRGCFHVFDEEEERAHFAAQVAAILAPGGLWLSLIGSTEGPPREFGPPRRSARDVTQAIEPALEIWSSALPSSALTGPRHGSAWHADAATGALQKTKRPRRNRVMGSNREMLSYPRLAWITFRRLPSFISLRWLWCR